MRTTQSGHTWHLDDDGDVQINTLHREVRVYLDEMDLVGMLRKVRLDRMAKAMGLQPVDPDDIEG